MYLVYHPKLGLQRVAFISKRLPKGSAYKELNHTSGFWRIKIRGNKQYRKPKRHIWQMALRNDLPNGLKAHALLLNIEI